MKEFDLRKLNVAASKLVRQLMTATGDVLKVNLSLRGQISLDNLFIGHQDEVETKTADIYEAMEEIKFDRVATEAQ